MADKTLSESLVFWMNRYNVSLSQLSDMIHYSKEHISRVRNGLDPGDKMRRTMVTFCSRGNYLPPKGW
jgi:hypothetical protein